MSSNISTFPVLNDELKSKIRFTVSDGYDFFYERDNQEFELTAEDTGGSQLTYNLIDEEGIWSPDEYGFGIRRSYDLQYYGCLFGEKGVACTDAVLGLAVIWTSAQSRQRGSIEIGEIDTNNLSEPLHFNIQYEFKKAQLRGTVLFKTVLYIKNAGCPTPDELHLANMEGCVLGELDRYQIQLDGNGSVFPVFEVSDPGQPLWYVKCDWEEPAYDLFTDCVGIYINTAHKNYKYLDRNKRTFDQQLLSEVMSSAVCTFIEKLRLDRGEWDNAVNGTGLQPGSVSSAVNYFINTLDWDISSPEKLAVSVRKFIDAGLK
jgi:hypothetical protein